MYKKARQMFFKLVKVPLAYTVAPSVGQMASRSMSLFIGFWPLLDEGHAYIGRLYKTLNRKSI